MSHQNRPVQFERVDHGHNVIAEAVGRLISGCKSGGAKPASCNAKNVVAGGELRGELVEDVRGVPAAGQQDHRSASTSPIEHFEAHIFGDLDKLDGMGGWILPRVVLLGVK